MPLPTESLNPSSTKEQIDAAISASIAQCVREGKDQAQCQAIAFSTAKKATRQGSGSEGGRQIRAGLGDS